MLSRALVLEAASSMDIAEVSIRALARRLRVTPGAIHYHFRGRDELLTALVNQLTDDFRFPRARADWRGWLRDYALNLKRAVRAHPGAARYMAAVGPTPGAQMRIIERALRYLEQAGFAPIDAWFAYATVVNFVLNHVVIEERLSKLRRGKRFENNLANTQDLPRLNAALGRGDATGLEALFCFGLQALLKGMGPSSNHREL